MTEPLSRFEVECLIAVAENPMGKGLDIKETLGSRYGSQINHGRLYPNLDTLAEKGLIKKHSRHQDDRSNAYEITTKGVQTLQELEETIRGGIERCQA